MSRLVGTIGPVGVAGPPGIPGFIVYKYALVTVVSEVDIDFGYTKGKKYSFSQISDNIEEGYYISNNILKPICVSKKDFDDNFGYLEDLRDLTINKILDE